MISDFCHEIDENCILLGYYGTSSGNSLPTLRCNLLVPSSRGKNVTRKLGGSYCGVYVGKSVGGDKFSVAWNQPIGSM